MTIGYLYNKKLHFVMFSVTAQHRLGRLSGRIRIVVSIPACHAGGRSSILRCGASFFLPFAIFCLPVTFNRQLGIDRISQAAAALLIVIDVHSAFALNSSCVFCCGRWSLCLS